MTEPPDPGEACQRCGSIGDDRRTLWMDCFYAMGELGIPFGRRAVLGRVCEAAATRLVEGINVKIPVWGEPRGDSCHRGFYTLRVCKRCRAEWLFAIKRWFEAAPLGDDHDAGERTPPVGSGIFVRENGAIREISREEWDARYQGDPVTFKGDAP